MCFLRKLPSSETCEDAHGFDQQRLRFGARKTRVFAGRPRHYDGTFLHAFNCASYRALRQRFSPGVVNARGPWSSGSTSGGGG
ncbi:hypothetical protein APR49_43390 [Variovorax paradoxus]|nr:hypothetical protein APR49_43390 [Variovorax paradoxus]